MRLILLCGAIIFLKTLMLHFTLSSSGKLSVSSRLAHAVCEQRDEYSASKQIAPPLKNVPPSSPDLPCGWFTIDKCPDCLLKFWTCAQAGKGRGISSKKGKGAGKGKGARKASKFRSAGSKVEPDLLAELQQKGGSSATIIISLEGGNSRALKAARSTSFKTRGEKVNTIVQSLQDLAKQSQKPILNQIEKTRKRLSSLSVSTLWITNQIVVEDADLALVEELAKIPEVSKITPDYIVEYSGNIIDELESESGPESERKKREIGTLAHEGWNLKEIEVAPIWKENIKGQGVVVGDIGSGARGSHVGLKDNFRSDHGWFDTVKGASSPTDDLGHGTQNLGVMVTPLNNMGVAPGAKWVACRAFTKDSGSYKNVTRCCEWMLCPTDPKGENKDCSKAPRVVNSNFLVNKGPSDFTGVINAWRKAEIIPIFGVSNVHDHEACGTMPTPADYDTVLSVGALIMDNNGVIRRAGSVGKGPAKSGKMKPDIVGPANLAQTLSHEADDKLLTGPDGTNTASAHVVGIIALLLSVKKDLTFANIYEILTKSAKKLDKTLGKKCGGMGEDIYPNYFVGYGRVNAVTAFKYMRENFMKS